MLAVGKKNCFGPRAWASEVPIPEASRDSEGIVLVITLNWRIGALSK